MKKSIAERKVFKNLFTLSDSTTYLQDDFLTQQLVRVERISATGADGNKRGISKVSLFSGMLSHGQDRI